MYYLYNNNRLVPLGNNSEDSIAIAQFTDSILVSNKMDEVIQISHYPKAAFLLHSKNISTLFSCWKYQLHYHTLNEFRIIIYAAQKNFLYRFLSLISTLSCGTYQLIDFSKLNEST